VPYAIDFRNPQRCANRATGGRELVASRDEPWELYDIMAGRTELEDLAGMMPDKVKRLVASWDVWAARCGLKPRPDLKRLVAQPPSANP
jgi:hypothetical protein